MCGRYSLTKPIKTLQEHFMAKVIFSDHAARYNIAPSQTVPIVVASQDGLEIRPLRWGLVPHWSKDEKMGQRLINARAETVHEKPSFRDAFRSKRCLVPADGFFEWQVQNGGKIPQYITRTDRNLMAFAGLWSEWKGNSKTLNTFTIITTQANRQLEPVHHRMPVILSPESYETWTSNASKPDILKNLLKPLPEGILEYFPVSKTVNSPKNDSEDCLVPADS